MDQHVDRAADPFDLAHQAVDLGRLGYVDLARFERAATRRPGPRLQRRQLAFQDIAGPHPGAAFDEALDDSAADAARGTGDDDRLVVEPEPSAVHSAACASPSCGNSATATSKARRTSLPSPRR